MILMGSGGLMAMAAVLLILACTLPQITTVSAQEISHNANTKFQNLPPSGIKNYFVYVAPTTQWPINLNSSLVDATSYWQKTTDVKFKFVAEPEQASIIIRWIKESNSPYTAYIISNSLIEVALGDSRCDGTWHQYDQDFITSLIKHELGHALGYKHSNDPTSIMYPLVHNAKYAPFVETYSLGPDQPIFVPTCSFSSISSFHYKMTGENNKQLNAFFVDSEKQYVRLLRGRNFHIINKTVAMFPTRTIMKEYARMFLQTPV